MISNDQICNELIEGLVVLVLDSGYKEEPFLLLRIGVVEVQNNSICLKAFKKDCPQGHIFPGMKVAIYNRNLKFIETIQIENSASLNKGDGLNLDIILKTTPEDIVKLSTTFDKNTVEENYLF